MAPPAVSVVIPTHRRETRLAFALESLAAPTLAAERFEVIVVRSEDEPGADRAIPPEGVQVREITSTRAGTGIQRNLGWRAARAPIVAFTDDDCRAAPQWLERLIEALDDERWIVQGRTEPDPDERHLLHGIARSIRNEHASGWYETCNIAYARSALDRLGGFDESIEFLGEDADLGARATRAGATLRFADDALVWHAVHVRPLPTALRDAVRRGSRPAIVARHPELRRALFLGVFADRDHARTLLALLGICALRRTPRLALLAFLPYLNRRVNRSTMSPWRFARLPMRLGSRFIVDAAELASFAISSARHRTVVL